MNPIETVAIDTLTPHPQNPRRGNIAAIAESIRTNGWWGVIVAQTSTRHVLAGNHRLQAARLAGLDTVPVHWLDVPDDVALRVLLADNRSGDQAGYDDDSLAELLAAIRDETGTLDGTLFTSDDLAGSVEEGSVKGDDKAHQTQKPVGVIAHIISACEQGGIVLDPFGGSGTTLIACDSSGRRARLVELSPAYCDVIRQRYADHANRPDLAP